MLTRLEADTGFSKALNVVRRHGSLARFQYTKQVTIFHHAQALIPRVVVRSEVAHVGLITHLALDNAQKQPTHEFRVLTGALIKQPGNGDITSPSEPVRGFCR